MKKIIYIICSLYIFCSLTTLETVAQTETHLKDSDIYGIIDTVFKCLQVNYVFPEKVKEWELKIRQSGNISNYLKMDNLEKFINQLSSDIRKISNDKHFGMRYIEKSDVQSQHNQTSISAEDLMQRKKKNFFFKKVEWLPCNVGYLRFDRFEDVSIAGETVSNAMNFLSRCDAIIIDLRYNPGGNENMVKFLASYFFDKPTKLNSLYFTKQDSTAQSWTQAFVPGSKLTNADVYILTGPGTASAAEAFTYDMVTYKKASVVGERTRGAAHWAEYFYYPSLHVEIKMPVARPISPITNTSWEGTGITPDIKAPEYDALQVAYLTALERMKEKSTDERELTDLEWNIKIVKARLENALISKTDMMDYAGEYGKLKIIFKDGFIFWHQAVNAELLLLPITKDLFTFTDSYDYLVKFVRDKMNNVNGYQLLVKGSSDGKVHNKKMDK